MSAGFIYFVPGIVGAVTVYLAERKERRSWGYYVAALILAISCSCPSWFKRTMEILVEGIICAVIIAPLFAILGAVGGIAMGAICRPG